jgi:16S rRNA (adenine1518-N6/adenine1519-N6)-dimethyltransferase
MEPKKHYGQHFLHDSGSIQRIVGTLAPAAGETVLEIGPGRGALTAALCHKAWPVRAVEVDAALAQYLRAQLPARQLEIWQADILQLTLPAGSYYLVGNLPYNISSQILFWLLAHRKQIREAVVMLQAEVADRICAAPGNKTYGVLSVLLGRYFERQRCFRLKKGAFVPPPKVTSAVLKLKRHTPLPSQPRFESLQYVVKTAFQQRRKTLRNALSGSGIPLPEAWQTRRAEELSIEDFVYLTNCYEHA